MKLGKECKELAIQFLQELDDEQDEKFLQQIYTIILKYNRRKAQHGKD